MMTQDEFRDCLIAYLADALEPSQAVLVLSMLDQPKYQQVLDQMMKEDQERDNGAHPAFPVIHQRIKQELMDRIARETDTPVYKINGIRKWWWAAAAVVVAMAVTVYFWPPRLQDDPLVRVNPQVPQDLPPGRNGASLTLADGRTIELDSIDNGVIAKEEGSEAILQNGQLTYNDTRENSHETVFNTMTTPKGRQFQLKLPDGTLVWLNAASSIRYPTRFDGSSREVTVSGEAYFEVAHVTEKGKRVPFRVLLNDQTAVEVLGTHFNVQAYPDEKGITTTLLEGSVKVTKATGSMLLKPGQQSIANRNDNLLLVQHPDISKAMAWKNGLFNFEQSSLEDVMKQLSRWYNIEVIYEKGIPKITFAGEMSRNLRLSGILKALENAEVHFRLEEGRRLVVMP